MSRPLSAAAEQRDAGGGAGWELAEGGVSPRGAPLPTDLPKQRPAAQDDAGGEKFLWQQHNLKERKSLVCNFIHVCWWFFFSPSFFASPTFASPLEIGKYTSTPKEIECQVLY